MYAYEGTSIEDTIVNYGECRDFFNEKGFEVGGNWDYDHGFFDKKLKSETGYLFIRIPVMVEEGEFGQDQAVVRLGRPFLLHHKFQIGNDDRVQINTGYAFTNAWVNQFSEPQDPDASLEENDIEMGRTHIQTLEEAFQQRFKKS